MLGNDMCVCKIDNQDCVNVKTNVLALIKMFWLSGDAWILRQLESWIWFPNPVPNNHMHTVYLSTKRKTNLLRCVYFLQKYGVHNSWVSDIC